MDPSVAGTLHLYRGMKGDSYCALGSAQMVCKYMSVHPDRAWTIDQQDDSGFA